MEKETELIYDPQIIKGSYICFKGMTEIKIYAFVVKLNEKSFNYIRDSLTRWDADVVFLTESTIITEQEFINKVQLNASNSNKKVPTNEMVLKALKMYFNNFEETTANDIYKLFNN